MKVSLLTYWGADNYGATLQAYATIRILKDYGHDVELINLQIDNPQQSLLKRVILYPKHLKFNRFRKRYFVCSQPYSSLEALQTKPPIADYYMVGSDQTWNPDISKDKARAFFLDFGGKNIKRITYASSFGKDKWEDSKWITKKDVVKLLSQFNSIAIRENSGVKILNEFGLKSVQVLDPVLLYDQYPELIGTPKQKEELVLYKLVNTKEFYNKAKLIGRQLNIHVRSIGSIRRIKGIRCAYPESIPGWMARIAGGQYIITDSFHGTVISLLYQKQFVVCVGNPKLVTRIKSLLTLVNLEDRIMSVNDSIEDIMGKLMRPIDYAMVNSILANERKISKEYLTKTII